MVIAPRIVCYWGARVFRAHGNRQGLTQTVSPLMCISLRRLDHTVPAGMRACIQSKFAAAQLDYLSGMTIRRSLVSTTKMASSFAGSVALAFLLT